MKAPTRPMNIYILKERDKETARMNLPIMLERGATFKINSKQYKVDAVTMFKNYAEIQCNVASVFFSMTVQE